MDQHPRGRRRRALAKADLTRDDIAAVGITNQRETAVVWDRSTGKPVHNAIVWQDTRTERICDELARRRGPDRYQDRDRPAARDLLRRARRSAGSSTTSTARASGPRPGELLLRHHRHLAAVEHHRRAGRRLTSPTSPTPHAPC